MEQMLKDPKKPEQSELLEKLIKEGLLDKEGKGKLRLTPRAIGRMQRRALMEVFSNLRQGQREGHEKITAGQGGERIEGTKPYQYGDPVSASWTFTRRCATRWRGRDCRRRTSASDQGT